MSAFRKGFAMSGTDLINYGCAYRLVWPSIVLQSARDRVATAAETVTASRYGAPCP